MLCVCLTSPRCLFGLLPAAACPTQRYADEGNQHVDAAPADVVFLVDALPNPVYVRDGDHLRRTITISLQAALLGFSEQLVHLDGRRVMVTNSLPTHPGGLPFLGVLPLCPVCVSCWMWEPIRPSMCVCVSLCRSRDCVEG